MKYCKMPVLFSGGHKLCHMSSAQCTKTNKQKTTNNPRRVFLTYKHVWSLTKEILDYSKIKITSTKMIRIKTTNSTSNVSDICVYQMVKNKIKITRKCKD